MWEFEETIKEIFARFENRRVNCLDADYYDSREDAFYKAEDHRQDMDNLVDELKGIEVAITDPDIACLISDFITHLRFKAEDALKEAERTVEVLQ